MEGSDRPSPVVSWYIGKLLLVHFTSCTGWPYKEEIAHTTKFNSLKDLAIRLGCDYLRELVCGKKNAQYSSEQIVAELLQCLSLVIEEQILSDLQSSDLFSLMTDESTDIAILKTA